ncbi:hypothetical protein DICPUDRAFT_81123 [Dictyostelium purpureum]|uniref:Uncharacterized protein n=1 Tax=Dictyostelium purpureum TaxID=5786 RepID=F0ZSJ9_DICPU|nr:uncharacterized protein DICPUDRAFT_81123 [Dictyostelium purpureum]EGC33078.1 hypothetical protein DICPUDRAFT_81123 [Dictyostelium purpureum]|eukprot:XP_003290391.1 hypothetical protein DICPUDRAFT_81123 [Dictyostelium purpureum]
MNPINGASSKSMLNSSESISFSENELLGLGNSLGGGSCGFNPSHPINNNFNLSEICFKPLENKQIYLAYVYQLKPFNTLTGSAVSSIYKDLAYVYQMHSEPIKRDLYYLQIIININPITNYCSIIISKLTAININNYHKKSQSRRNSNSFKVFQSLVNQLRQNSNQLQVHVKIQKR